VAQANEAAQLPQGNANLVKGLVAYGDPFVANPQAVLEAHIEAGQGRMRGVRVRAAWHPDPAFAAPHDGPDEHTIGAPELDQSTPVHDWLPDDIVCGPFRLASPAAYR
jgi:hypothetical protein